MTLGKVIIAFMTSTLKSPLDYPELTRRRFKAPHHVPHRRTNQLFINWVNTA